jgi:hypothetical protein
MPSKLFQVSKTSQGACRLDGEHLLSSPPLFIRPPTFHWVVITIIVNNTVIYVSLIYPNWNDQVLLLQLSFSKILTGRNVLLILKIVCEYYFDFSWWICHAVVKIVVGHWVIWQNWNSNMILKNLYFIHHSTRWFVLLSKFTLKKCVYNTKTWKLWRNLVLKPCRDVSLTGGVPLTHWWL